MLGTDSINVQSKVVEKVVEVAHGFHCLMSERARASESLGKDI
jgi:hypothetical protein